MGGVGERGGGGGERCSACWRRPHVAQCTHSHARTHARAPTHAQPRRHNPPVPHLQHIVPARAQHDERHVQHQHQRARPQQGAPLEQGGGDGGGEAVLRGACMCVGGGSGAGKGGAESHGRGGAESHGRGGAESHGRGGAAPAMHQPHTHRNQESKQSRARLACSESTADSFMIAARTMHRMPTQLATVPLAGLTAPLSACLFRGRGGGGIARTNG